MGFPKLPNKGTGFKVPTDYLTDVQKKGAPPLQDRAKIMSGTGDATNEAFRKVIMSKDVPYKPKGY